MFVDKARITVRSGAGGRGAVAFRREKYVPMGGPSGGDGGRGGDVWLVADREVATLGRFRHRQEFSAESGGSGASANRHGAAGAPLEIAVPLGTIATDVQSGERVADLLQPQQRTLVAHGGMGGRGNARFTSSTRQIPHFAEKGEPGQERELDLELRVLADVGLVGRPNAGKSTLLSAISAARPKVAPYPFTTLQPELGVVRYGDSEFVVADIPGLMEGAHRGAGLGHEFLRHVERTRLLLFVLDTAGTEGTTPLEDLQVLERELELHNPELLHRPRLVVGNKMDLPEAAPNWAAMLPVLNRRDIPCFAVSAASGQGTDVLIRAIALRLADLPRWQEDANSTHSAEEVITLSHRRRGAVVTEAEPDTYVVVGPEIERLVAMADLENPEALEYLTIRLERRGLFRDLARAGARQGSILRFGKVSLVLGADGRSVETGADGLGL